MKVINYPVLITESYELNTIQSNTAQGFEDLMSDPLLSGVEIYSVALSVGSNSIGHLLGSVPRGWLVIDIDGVSNIYKESADSKRLNLNSSAAVTVSIRVW